MIQIVGTQLSQWDVGRSVSIANSDATHIHFANQCDSKAVIIEITDGSAKIPDYLLQTGKQVIAYAVLDGVTLESKSFPVRKRERPENYVYEEDQRNYIYELITNAKNATESARMAALAADLAADNTSIAIETAYNAATSATDAAAAANNAAQNANKAAKYALADSIINEASGSKITLKDSSNRELQGLTISEPATVKVMGKNIADLRKVSAKDLNTASATAVLTNSFGTTLSATSGDSITVTQSKWPNAENPKSYQNGYVVFGFYCHLVAGDVVTVSFDYEITENPLSVAKTDISLTWANGYQSIANTTENGRVYLTQYINSSTAPQADGWLYLDFRNCGTSGVISNFQVEYGSTATDYEPYKVQTLVVTDLENIDYAQLHTYKPCTTITNDAGAEMSVEYVADTKTYIDNKFTELQNAILSSGANV